MGTVLGIDGFELDYLCCCHYLLVIAAFTHYSSPLLDCAQNYNFLIYDKKKKSTDKSCPRTSKISNTDIF